MDYSKLRTGDMVVCGGTGPAAAVIRSVTAGWRRWNDKSVAVHTGIIVRWAGQYFVAEMLGRGITLSPPSRYEGKKRRYIIGIRRNHAYDSTTARGILNKRIAKLYRNSLEYDFKGILSYVFENCQENPNRYYCSELFKAATPEVSYPEEFDKQVSPFDLQHVVGWKWI